LFTDVVTAYKGLIKEKEALEASLKILNDKTSKNSDAQAAAEQKQLKILTESLSVLSAEKSRMESNFQADKKKLRGEVEMVITHPLRMLWNDFLKLPNYTILINNLQPTNCTLSLSYTPGIKEKLI
jgi:hypothetical protein